MRFRCSATAFPRGGSYFSYFRVPKCAEGVGGSRYWGSINGVREQDRTGSCENVNFQVIPSAALSTAVSADAKPRFGVQPDENCLSVSLRKACSKALSQEWIVPMHLNIAARLGVLEALRCGFGAWRWMHC